jgi:hypothetical protein
MRLITLIENEATTRKKSSIHKDSTFRYCAVAAATRSLRVSLPWIKIQGFNLPSQPRFQHAGYFFFTAFFLPADFFLPAVDAETFDFAWLDFFGLPKAFAQLSV